MAKITKIKKRSPDRKDTLLGVEYLTGATSNFTLGSIENLFMSTKADRKIPVESERDFTTDEPMEWDEGDRYINTGTGEGSSSGTPVVANYIYEIVDGVWHEIVPVAGFTLFNKERFRNLVYTGSAWVSNSITQAEFDLNLQEGLGAVNNQFSQNFEFDEDGNIISFSEAYNTRVKNNLTGDGFALSTEVAEVGSDLNTLEGNFSANSRDVQNTFAGIPGTFKQDNPPSVDEALNSIWYDTNDGNKIYALQESIYVGAPHEWVEITDERLEELRIGVGASRSFLVDANGKVAGMKIGITDTGPSFISFLADTFKIFNNDPSGTGVDVAPFEVVNGEVKIKSAQIGQINVGSIPDEVQTTIVYATDSIGTDASTDRYLSAGVERTHWHLADTRWVNGDSIPTEWVFERISGQDAYSILVSNDNHSISTLADGTLDLTGTGTVITVFKGEVELDGRVSGTPGPGEYRVTPTPNGIGIGTISSVGDRVIVQDMPVNTTMAGASASIDYLINIEGTTTVTKTQSFSKSLQGEPGIDAVDAKTIKLTPSKHVINYAKDGSETDSITFSTALQGIVTQHEDSVNGTFVGYSYYVDGVAASGNPNTSASGSTFTLPDAQEPGSGEVVTVGVEIISNGVILATDSVSIYGVQDGKDALTGFLTNSSHVLAAAANGSVTSAEFANAGGEFKVFVGGEDVSTDCTFIIADFHGALGMGSTIGSSTGVYDITAVGPDSAKITYRATVPASVAKQSSSVTIDLDYSVSKAKVGAQGVQGISIAGLVTSTGVIFYKTASTSTPSIPVTTSSNGDPITFDFSTGNFTNLDTTLWSKNSPEIAPGTSSSSFYTSRYYVTESAVGSGSGTVTFSTPVSAYNFSQVVTFSSLGANGTTEIDGGRMKTGSIESGSYLPPLSNEIFSQAGTKIDLLNGSINSKKFDISSSGDATFGGIHASGSIGNWEINNGKLQDGNGRIVLDPAAKKIEINNSNGELKAFLSASDDLSNSLGSNVQISPNVPSGSDWRSTTLNFNLPTNNSLGVDNDDYEDHASAEVKAVSTQVTIPKTGVYEIDASDFEVEEYPSFFTNSILSDMSMATVSVPATLSSSLRSELNAANVIQYGNVGVNYSPRNSKCLIETILQVGPAIPNDSSDIASVTAEHVLARQELWKRMGEVESFVTDWYAAYLTSVATITNTAFSDWKKATVSSGTTDLIFPFENFERGNLIFEATENDNMRVKIVTRVTVVPGVSLYRGGTLSSAGTKSLESFTFVRSGGNFEAITGNIEALLPENFSELSGGGLQVITNTDRYARMVRHTLTPASGNTLNLLEVKGGETVLKNIGGTALKLYGGSSTSNLLEVYGPITCNATLNGLDISRIATSAAESGGWNYPGSQQTSETAMFQDLATNKSDYAVLPGGVIIQWGHVFDTTSSEVKEVIFPMVFPHGVGSVVCSTNRQSSGNSGYNHVHSYGRSKCKLVLDDEYGFWIAIGS
jgi:hypothetical protein